MEGLQKTLCHGLTDCHRRPKERLRPRGKLAKGEASDHWGGQSWEGAGEVRERTPEQSS